MDGIPRDSITIVERGADGKVIKITKIYPEKPFMLDKPRPATPKN